MQFTIWIHIKSWGEWDCFVNLKDSKRWNVDVKWSEPRSECHTGTDPRRPRYIRSVSFLSSASFSPHPSTSALYQPCLSTPKTSPGKHLGFLLMSRLCNAYNTNTAGVIVCPCSFMCLHALVSTIFVPVFPPTQWATVWVCVCVSVSGVPHQHFHCSDREKKGRRASPPPPPPLPHSLRPSRQPPSGLLPSGSFHPVVGFFAVSKQDKTGADCICSPLAADVGFGEAGAAARGGSMHIRYLTKGRKEAGSYVNMHLLS